MLKLHHILQAQQRIKPYIRQTPLMYSEALSERTGAKVWLKLECRQPTGSFKIRGALHKVMSLTPEDLAAGVVTASAGNHGLGLAYAARSLGLDHVTVFVPSTTPKAKVAKLSRFPIELRQTGQTYEAAHQAAEEFAKETGATYISAYDDPQVIAGAGTCGLEIMTELPQVDAIVVPIGGGGLVAGIGVAVKGINPFCRLIGVQPTASPAAKLSFEQNIPLDPYEHEPTIADGLAGGFGAHPFYIARTLIDEILLFSEDDLRQAVFTLVDQEQLVVEASGAIALAPLLADQHTFGEQTVVCVLTGANIDTRLLGEILRDVRKIKTGQPKLQTFLKTLPKD
jgi:threonine dehydratase